MPEQQAAKEVPKPEETETVQKANECQNFD